MSQIKDIQRRTAKRAFRTRMKFASRGTMLRVSVYRSLKHIRAQIIDDAAGKTLVSASSTTLKDTKGDKKVIAKSLGLALGKLAQEQSITEVYFDRGSYLYHGRVAAFADGLRESGLKL